MAMIAKLSAETIHQIRNSKGRVVDVASRLGVSIATVSRYRPVRRKHLTDAEQDQIITEWLCGIPTKDTAGRFGIIRQTIHAVRQRSMAALLGEKANGPA